MFKLGEEQVEAIDKIKEFIDSEEIAFSLQGFAGTGKSTIIKTICDYLDEKYIGYTLVAPTHKAKLVLERFTEVGAITLHKLLALFPNVEIFELDLKELIFRTNGELLLFPRNGLIICDEASMVNDDLYDLLMLKAKLFHCKIIFVGDRAQLRPVNASEYSKVFDITNSYTLQHIYRQEVESGLSAVLPTLRNSIIPVFRDRVGTQGSVLCYNNTLQFFKQAYPYFKKAIRDADILEAKFLAYTNNRVNALNEKMRELLFGAEKEYNRFEFLTGYDNIEFNYGNFYNSMDYIIIDEPIKKDIQIPFFVKLPGYVLNLYDDSSKTSNEVFILSRDIPKDYIDSLAYTIEGIRLEAVSLKANRDRFASKRWKDYFQLINSFANPIDLYYDGRLIKKRSFNYGYAITTHKSQGSSINNVFIDMRDISICKDMEELRQLQYVSVSRARTNVFILQ